MWKDSGTLVTPTKDTDMEQKTFKRLTKLMDDRIDSINRRIASPKEPHEVKIILKIRLEELLQLQDLHRNWS